jgi:hypothetical protein
MLLLFWILNKVSSRGHLYGPNIAYAFFEILDVSRILIPPGFSELHWIVPFYRLQALLKDTAYVQIKRQEHAYSGEISIMVTE